MEKCCEDADPHIKLLLFQMGEEISWLTLCGSFQGEDTAGQGLGFTFIRGKVSPGGGDEKLIQIVTAKAAGRDQLNGQADGLKDFACG